MTVTEFPVLEAATGRTLRIPTANMMTTVAVKTTVPTPLGYAVEPGAAADFAAAARTPRHPVREARGAEGRPGRAVHRSLRLEDEFDEVYSRYEGRQIVRCEAAAARSLPAGTLWVPLQGEAAVRAALVLEPAALYGVYP